MMNCAVLLTDIWVLKMAHVVYFSGLAYVAAISAL